MPKNLGRLGIPVRASAPASPYLGETYYDSVLDQARVWDGATWQAQKQAFVGPTQPTAPGPYLWVQTGLGATGADWTFWIEDGAT